MSAESALVEERFRELFVRYHADVAAYVARRAPASLAEEVVEETFVVAWRSFDRIRGDPLPWLYGVARRTLANQLRGIERRHRLIQQLASQPQVPQPEPLSDLVSPSLRDALLELSDADREALLLIAWEGLTPSQAARVVGCSSPAFRVRLHRARRRLERVLSLDSPVEPRLNEEQA
ncbi:MAG TPA: sigma-70 family RNA polymerase sigma factor [Gaiellaceae bacterium]|nr:sigma-70 family RNA polymerase sigma factor [Gaiellaceae bacterium]